MNAEEHAREIFERVSEDTSIRTFTLVSQIIDRLVDAKENEEYIGRVDVQVDIIEYVKAYEAQARKEALREVYVKANRSASADVIRHEIKKLMEKENRQ